MDSLHHANLLVGRRELAESYVTSLLQKLGIKISNNPDYFPFKNETFGIGEARDLTLLAGRKALGKEKIFLIIPGRITLEAQNALLKTFEEPFPNTYFFLVVREEALVIPTLRSRMRVIILDSLPETEEAKEFIKLPLSKRILFAKKFSDDGKNLTVFLDSLLSFFRAKEEGTNVEKIYRLRRIVGEGALPRLVIEHLALVL